MEEKVLSKSIDVTISMPWGHIAGRWYGNREQRPILALHGWLDNMGTWNNLLPLLPPHIGVLCIDLPGHGHSAKLPKGVVYHAVEYICVILRIMQVYNWTKVSILSHSMSSMLSFLFAALYPQHMDMLICIDAVRTCYHQPDKQIAFIRERFEKCLIEDERLESAASTEPPSYTYAQLEHILYNGSSESVELENCKHILERNVTKSGLFPDKYYFSRDGRVKHYFEFTTSPPFAAELAKRVCNLPYCVIKASKSNFINEESAEVIAILKANNPHFEIHEVQGTHHVHLNNATDVAPILNSFITRHRPPLLKTWTLEDDADEISRANANQQASMRSKWKSKL